MVVVDDEVLGEPVLYIAGIDEIIFDIVLGVVGMAEDAGMVAPGACPFLQAAV